VDESGTLYICDTGNSRVVVVDSTGRLLHTLGRAGSGPGEFRYPLAVRASGDGVFVLDYGNARIQAFDRRLRYVASLPLREPAETFAASAQRGELFVVTDPGARRHLVQVFSSRPPFEWKTSFLRPLFPHKRGESMGRYLTSNQVLLAVDRPGGHLAISFQYVPMLRVCDARGRVRLGFRFVGKRVDDFAKPIGGRFKATGPAMKVFIVDLTFDARGRLYCLIPPNYLVVFEGFDRPPVLLRPVLNGSNRPLFWGVAAHGNLVYLTTLDGVVVKYVQDADLF